MKLIDLSVSVENSCSEPMKIKVKRLDHISGAKKFCKTIAWNKHMPFMKRLKAFLAYLFGSRRIEPSDFPDGVFISLDTITMPSHMGTHIDAPYHFGLSQSHENKTADQIPLEWCFRPGVKLDFRQKKSAEQISVEDLKKALSDIKYKVKPLDIILIWTGTDKLWGKPEYFSTAPGMSREATEWLIERGIKVIGIDTYSFDRPFPAMLNAFWKTGDKKELWPAHFLGREKEYIHIERLVNLELLPAKGFYVSCFPIKLKGMDASWIRAVGILDMPTDN